MQNFNFNHLYYFHVVASEGSLAAAARALNLTVPTISQQLKQLEVFLGSKLFHRRSGDALRLNEQGRMVFEHTSVMFRSSNRLLGRFRPDLPGDAVVLGVGVTSSVSRTFAGRFFLPLLQMAEIKPRIVGGEHDHLLHELVTLALDLLLTDHAPRGLEARGLQARAIHRPSLVAVAAPDLAGAGGGASALDGIPFFGYPASTRYRWEVDQYLREVGVEPEVIGETDDVGLMVTAALHGLCAAIVPAELVDDAIAADSLAELARLPPPEPRVWALYHRKETPDRVLDAIDRLTQPSVDGSPEG